MLSRSNPRNLRSAIVVARGRSREIGIDSLVRDAEALGVDTSGHIALPEFVRDYRRAERIARGYQHRELTDVARERIAVTESSEAFSSGRSAFARGFHHPSLIKVWKSELDACSICYSADGHMVGIHENFPLGEPGSVHPFCRCYWDLLSEQ